MVSHMLNDMISPPGSCYNTVVIHLRLRLAKAKMIRQQGLEVFLEVHLKTQIGDPKKCVEVVVAIHF